MNATASPIAVLLTAVERAEPRYRRAAAIEEGLSARYGVPSDNVRLRRATAVTEGHGRRIGAAVRIISSIRAASLSDLSLKAALALREDNEEVLRSLARDVLALRLDGFSPRSRTGTVLAAGTIAP